MFWPDAGQSCNMQTAGTEMPGMEYQHVGRDSALHEGIWLNKSPDFMESAWKMRYRITLHQPPEEAIRATERDSLNGQRKRHIWDKDGNEAGSFFVQFTLQHGAPNGTERWCGTLAKIKRHGYTIWRLWIWLPHEPALRGRRTPVLYLAGAAPEHGVRLQAEHWKCRIENPPRQDENSEQPKYEQKKRIGDQQH